MMTRLRMAPTVQAANRFVEGGHVRVGTVSAGFFLLGRGGGGGVFFRWGGGRGMGGGGGGWGGVVSSRWVCVR